MAVKQNNKSNSFNCYIKNKTDISADIYFYGDIIAADSEWREPDDKCPMDVVKILDECKDVTQLNIYINSAGGNVFAGYAIYNRLKMHPAHKTVYVDGLAASISSVIAMVGDEIIMPQNTFLMIHKAWTLAVGNSNELRAAADRLDNIEQGIVSIYASNSEKSEEEIQSLMATETWLSAQEAANTFKNVKIIKENEVAACITDLKYNNVPRQLSLLPIKNRTNQTNNKEEDAKKFENSISMIENFVFMEGEVENEQENA